MFFVMFIGYLTPRVSSKILRCASYFQLSSRCLDTPIKHCFSCLIYYVINMKWINKSTQVRKIILSLVEYHIHAKYSGLSPAVSKWPLLVDNKILNGRSPKWRRKLEGRGRTLLWLRPFAKLTLTMWNRWDYVHLNTCWLLNTARWATRSVESRSKSFCPLNDVHFSLNGLLSKCVLWHFGEHLLLKVNLDNRNQRLNYVNNQ